MAKVREKVRYPLKKAERIAEGIERKLAPLAKELILVGSIRRRRPEVADIEFVVLPKDLQKFGQAMKRMGYAKKPAGRQWSHVIGGIPTDIYVAFVPEEMGSMVQMYTGDFLYNITMRNRALARGLKYNQYGIFTRDDKPVYQSPDEEDIFEYLGKEWREPEQRSLAARQDLERLARDLKAARESIGEKAFTFVTEVLRTLKHDKYLPAREEFKLRALHTEQFAPKAKTKLAGWALGAEELIELGAAPFLDRIPASYFWNAWQEAYEEAVGGAGRVTDVFGQLNPDGSLSIYVVVQGGGRLLYMPYWDPAPSSEEVELVLADERAWLDDKTMGIDWRYAEWGPPVEEGPV